MFKAIAHKEDHVMISLGLSRSNIEQLKKNNPILLNLNQLHPSLDQDICISWISPKGAATPHGYTGWLFALSTDVMDKMLDESHYTLYTEGNLRIAIFAAETEQEIEREWRAAGLIGPTTMQKRIGYAPSDIPPSLN